MPKLIIHPEFYAPQLQRQRAIRILLPKNYHKHPTRRFPVLYLQDGQNLFEKHTAAFGHWRLREFMARQPINRQAILVGIDHGGIDRIHEYAPWKRGNHGGQGHEYLNFVQHTLKPFIDREYRTWPHREATGIAGSSMGGLISLYAGLQFSHIFGKIGVLSPSIWFNPKVLEMAHTAHAIDKIYVSASKTEMRTMPATLEKIYWSLKKGGLPDEQFRVVMRPRGRHSEVFWRREFKNMYEWLFPVTAY